ncbi:MAG: DUF5060 domain-containing protein [Roseiflexaceae bacterium]|nr:DUF5060 domain-containing protein [Roseiflexaceae bacterium]
MSLFSRSMLFLVLLVACATPTAPVVPATPNPTPVPTVAGPLPRIGGVTSDKATLGRYERIELSVALAATYDNPYDSQQVALSARFRAPSGKLWEIPGFWDGREAWLVRFTPGEIGTWQYVASVHDQYGSADSAEARFDVGPSEQHGWLQVASWRDPKLSSRYLAYHDGTPFYGIGHCDAFTLGDSRMDANGDLNLLKRMRDHGENLVVWWPHNTFTFFADSYKTYDRIDMALIDSYLASAERLGITVVYTIWDHNLLRGAGHPWGVGRWEQNGFRRITPKAADFFTDATSWRWQENLYRYIIARWGSSPAIIWMTASELDGTSAGDHQDAWHAKINDYFVRNDPYRHPTTASLSGDKFWDAGYAETDIPQVHLYEAQKDAQKMGDSVADWTTRLSSNQARPNVIGEFGTTNRAIDLPMLHNSIWAALMSGAAITPLRWSDRGSWGRMSDPLMKQLGYLHTFVADIPFPSLDLKPARLQANESTLAAHGLSNGTYAIAWVQDRQSDQEHTGTQLTINDMADGTYMIQPFDPWTGQALPNIQMQTQAGTLTISMPAFHRDLAFKIIRDS